MSGNGTKIKYTMKVSASSRVQEAQAELAAAMRRAEVERQLISPGEVKRIMLLASPGRDLTLKYQGNIIDKLA